MCDGIRSSLRTSQVLWRNVRYGLPDIPELARTVREQAQAQRPHNLTQQGGTEAVSRLRSGLVPARLPSGRKVRSTFPAASGFRRTGWDRTRASS